MQKIFAIFLLIVLMCFITSGVSNVPASAEQASAISQTGAENEVAIVDTQAHTGDADALETAVSTETAPEVMYYTEDEVVMVAKLLQRECGGVPSVTQQACVAWTVCNRVDSDEFEGDTITDVVTARYQFAYRENTPVYDELYEIALDVLNRWNAERNGEESVGRVLPKDYTFFAGDGGRNYFRNAYKGDYSIWDYSLPSPYES